MEKTKETKRAVVRSIISCVFFMFLMVSSVVFGFDEPNNVQGICYAATGTVEASGTCPAWFPAFNRNSTDAHTTEYLMVQLDRCQVFGNYTVYMMQQGAPAGYLADLEAGDLFIVWDEDEGHGGSTDFTFTGQYKVVDENGNNSIPVAGSCDYARVSSTNEAVINWVLYRVESAGTLTVNDTGLNEHDAIHLNLNIMPFTKDDDLADGQCASPEQSLTYTICFNNAYGETLEDAFVIDWLPAGVDYDALISIDPLVLDPNYNAEEHYYRWELGDIDPNETACLTLDVMVNYNTAPGSFLHNVAELWGTVLVPDPNDPNIVNPETRIVARVIKDTPVCCWQEMPEVLYVDKNATAGANNGLNWQNAFIDLQDALDYAQAQVCGEVNSIYVAQGTYAPQDTESGFVLPQGVSVYGGFPTGGCDFGLQNPKRYETILTGLIDEETIAAAVVTMGDNTLLDGFTVTNAFDYNIYGSNGDFTVAHCVIKECLFGFGIYAENGNAAIQWCTINKNGTTGIQHTGTGYMLTVDNSWILRNGEYGVYCENSTPTIRNSIISESDLMEQGREGVRMVNPTSQPKLLNNTIANNKAAGVFFVSNGDPNNPISPDIQNNIIYYNQGPQLSGINADLHADFCCIQDCNEPAGTTNFNDEPGFAYAVDPNGAPDPNNYHLSAASVCIGQANPFLDYTNQVDIDGEGFDRKYGDAVDVGADEVYDCHDDHLSDADVHNDCDFDADGIVNLDEFNTFSKAWLSFDPNCSHLPNPVDPNQILHWNPVCDLDHDLDVDETDLIQFCNNWLWIACWKLDEVNTAMMATQSSMQPLSLMPAPMMAQDNLSTASLQETSAPEPVFESVAMAEEPAIVQEDGEASAETLTEIIDFLNEALLTETDNVEGIEQIKAILQEELKTVLAVQSQSLSEKNDDSDALAEGEQK